MRPVNAAKWRSLIVSCLPAHGGQSVEPKNSRSSAPIGAKATQGPDALDELGGGRARYRIAARTIDQLAAGRLFLFAGVIALCAWAPVAAHAQATADDDVDGVGIETSERGTPDADERVVGAQAGSSVQNGPTDIGGIAPGPADMSRFEYFDQFGEPGTTTTFPGSEDSVFQDAGGYRSWLAERQIGIRTVPSISVVGNLLPSGQPREPQRFNGQRPTLQLAAQNINLTWRMDSVGLPHTQLIVAFNNTFTSFDANGRNSAYLRNLAIYQTFFDGKITIKAGLTPNNYEYVGFYVGGSPILASGIAGILPVQAGLGIDPANVPVVNATVYGSRGKYVRFGIQRSTSPLGINEEVRRRGGLFDFDLSSPGAGPLYVGEVGVRRPAKSGDKQIWLRMGGFYNDSSFTRFDGRGTKSNAAFYALADGQVTQPDPSAPAKGLYVGGSAYWIPQSVNTSHISFEGRAFVIGPFQSRPRDTVSLRATWVKFSDDAQQASLLRGQFANKEQLTITGSYSARLYHGIYAVPAISYIDHPSFIGDYKPALITALSISVLL